MPRRRGADGGSVSCQGHISRGIEGEEGAVHSLTPPTISADYESDSLTISPRLAPDYLYQSVVKVTGQSWQDLSSQL